MFKVVLTKQAVKDSKKIEKHNLKKKVIDLINIIKVDPYCYPPEFEHLKGEFKDLISRRINKQHRLVYEVLAEKNIIKIYRMWTHYE